MTGNWLPWYWILWQIIWIVPYFISYSVFYLMTLLMFGFRAADDILNH